MKNVRLLQECKDTKDVFKDPPLVAYCRDRNLSDLLVHSSDPKPSTTQTGTTTCSRKKCKTCSHINYTPCVVTKSGTFNIKQSFNCTSKNIIYAMTCSKCNKVYIGETKRRLGDRFREHLRYATMNSRDTPITGHFNETPHVPSDLRVTGLLHTPGPDSPRFRKEQTTIFKYGTLAGPTATALIFHLPLLKWKLRPGN